MTIQDIALEKARLEFGRACIDHNVLHQRLGDIPVSVWRNILKRTVTTYDAAVYYAVHHAVDVTITDR